MTENKYISMSCYYQLFLLYISLFYKIGNIFYVGLVLLFKKKKKLNLNSI